MALSSTYTHHPPTHLEIMFEKHKSEISQHSVIASFSNCMLYHTISPPSTPGKMFGKSVWNKLGWAEPHSKFPLKVQEHQLASLHRNEMIPFHSCWNKMNPFHSCWNGMTIPFWLEWDDHSILAGMECNHSIPVGMEAVIPARMEWSFHSGRNGMPFF